MLAAYQIDSGWGLAVSFIVIGTLFVAWVVSLFFVIGDSISAGAKVLWLVALTCLAPFAIPAYFVTRSHRAA